MYNPASILHTVERFCQENDSFPRLVFFTLGTNHVYRLKETGEIVDNCEKRPAALFQEELLSVDQCADFLQRAVTLLQSQLVAECSLAYSLARKVTTRASSPKPRFSSPSRS